MAGKTQCFYSFFNNEEKERKKPPHKAKAVFKKIKNQLLNLLIVEIFTIFRITALESKFSVRLNQNPSNKLIVHERQIAMQDRWFNSFRYLVYKKKGY
jgi:hypothetical protein